MGIRAVNPDHWQRDALHDKLAFDLNWLLAGQGPAPDENAIDHADLQRVAQEAAAYAVEQFRKRKKVSNGDDG